ncbi:MAG: DNA adenine methylase [Thermoplasmataceae archaeon]
MEKFMKYLRLIKYPGAKSALIGDLLRLEKVAGPGVFVDVFGGSGTMALNLPTKRIVYNDINLRLVEMFRSIQLNPEVIYAGLKREIAKLDVGHKYVRYYISSETVGVVNNRKSIHESEIKRALDTILTYSKSFGGEGETYATSHEKSVVPYLAKTIGEFGKISERVRLWTLEDLDFREIIRKYDSSGTLFYLDPPYPGKRWYEASFSDIDYRDLSAALGSIEGNYVMNLDRVDDNLLEIFGFPTFTKTYGKTDMQRAHGKMKPRVVSFYTNLRMTR